jgi:deazaflavin-dependent oxidoreductase (nitroreductase family)
MPPILRRIFHYLNKFFMVPIFRLGLGSFFVNPLSGYIMVLKAIGRKTGKVRYAPVNYAIKDGNVYCISGGRKTSDWYRNLLAVPDIEVLLPGGAVFGHVDEVTSQVERQAVIRQILKNAGFAGFFEGYNPFTISDEELARKTEDLPVLRIHPEGIGNGAADPAGWSWVWMAVFIILIIGIITILIK